MTEDLEKASKRTAEVMAAFSRHYVACYARAMMSDSVEEVVTMTLDAVKDTAKENKLKASKQQQGENEERKVVEEKASTADDGDGDDDDTALYVASIGSKRTARDVDLSEYTRYRVFAVKVAPKGSSIQTFETRYRMLRRLDEELKEKLAGKKTVVGTDKAEFPPKKFFGNMKAAFVKQRQKALSKYLDTISQDATVCSSSVFQTTMQFEEDEQAEFDWGVFCDAFSATCDEFNVWTREDPDDFDDEGTGLTVLMCDIVEKELLPDIRSKIWDNLPVAFLRSKALHEAHKTVNIATGKAVAAAWEGARPGFNKAKGAVAEVMEKQQDKVDAMLHKIVGKVAPKLVEKLAKHTQPKKPQPDPLTKGEIEPTLDKLAIGRELIEYVRNEPVAAKRLKELQKDIKGKFKAKKKLDKDLQKQIKLWKETPDVHHTMQIARNVVMGVLDLWLTTIQSLLDGVAPFFAAKDAIETKLAANADAKTAQSEWKAQQKAIESQLRKVASKIAVTFDKERRTLTKNLAGLSRKASGKLRKQVVKVPQKMLNFLGSLRVKFRAALTEAFANNDVAVENARATVRETFLAVGQAEFNKFFAGAWKDMVFAMLDAARTTLCERLEALADPIIEPLLEELGDAVPDPLVKAGVDLPGIVDNVVDATLRNLATKALAKGKIALEAKVFAPEEEEGEEEEEQDGDEENKEQNE